MAAHSFQLKGWTVTLVAALLAIASAAKGKAAYVAIAFIPVLVFWVLDAYFLWQERRFRAVFNHVRRLEEEAVDFDMNPPGLDEGAGSWGEAIFSKTLLIFYLSLAGLMAVVSLLLVK